MAQLLEQSKFVLDETIIQVFDQALNVNDDYLRLIKIAEGIRYITQKLQSVNTFNNPKIIFQLICLYPFQQDNIEQLITTFFECYNDFNFINAYYKAALEISQMQEFSKQGIVQKIQMRKNLTTIVRNGVTSNQQQQDNDLPFSKAVNSQLDLIKQFAASYLKKIFLIANTLKLDFQLYGLIFKYFIQNSVNQKLIENVMDCFQELRNTIFYNQQWIRQYCEQVDSYFKNHPKLLPQYKQKYDILFPEEEKSEQNEQQEQVIVVQDQKNKRRSFVSSEIDPIIYLQKLCCTQETGEELLHNSVFEDIENIDILLIFLLDPSQITMHEIWKEKFQVIPDIIDTDKLIFKRKSTTQLEKYQVFRSYKTLMLLTQPENFLSLLKLQPQIYAKIFLLINITLSDETKNINLYHLYFLLRFLIQGQPKLCIKQMLEQKIINLLLDYCYNEKIVEILIDILNIQTDRYSLGLIYYDELWNYLLEIKWIDYLFSKIYDQLYSINNLTIDQNAINSSLQVIKGISLLDVQKLLLSFQDDEKKSNSLIQIDIINTNNSDYDKLNQFFQEKEQTNIYINESLTIINQEQPKKNLSSNFYFPKIEIKSCQQLEPLTQNSAILDNRLTQINIKNQPIVSKRNENNQVRYKTKADQTSFDGFPSSKLTQIYPTARSLILQSKFEKEKINFNTNQFQQGCLDIYISLLDSLLQFVENNDNKLQTRSKQVENTKLLIYKFINKEHIQILFKIFLYLIFDSQKQQPIAIQCGQILNKLYMKISQVEYLHSLKSILQEEILLASDFIVKVIVQLNSQKLQIDTHYLSQLQFLLVSLMANGFFLFCGQSYEIKIDKIKRSVFRNLNDTVIHILLIWFFDSSQNTLYQQAFVKLIAIIFAGAPMPYLSNIIFKLGLITSLSNAYKKFYQNQIKDTAYNESMFFHILLLNYAIRTMIRMRNLDELLDLVCVLDSWNLLEYAQPLDNHNALLSIDELINAELIAPEKQNQKQVEKPSKFNRMKAQVNLKLTTLASLGSKRQSEHQENPFLKQSTKNIPSSKASTTQRK